MLKSSSLTSIHVSKFYNYAVSNQGQKETHGSDYKKDYFTDVIKREAVQFITDSSTKAKSGDAPFFAYIATPAPHRPMTPAPQYANNFSNWSAPRSPSYGMHGADKHWIISEGTVEHNIIMLHGAAIQCVVLFTGTPTMTSQIAGIIDDQYRDRLRSLLSVDDLVEEVVKTLEVRNQDSLQSFMIDQLMCFLIRKMGYWTIPSYFTTAIMVCFISPVCCSLLYLLIYNDRLSLGPIQSTRREETAV